VNDADAWGHQVTAPAWERLHPLSPVVRGGRSAGGLILLVVVASSVRQQGSGGTGGSGTTLAFDVGLVVLVVLVGLVNWLVTRWSFDGVTLRIETGLVRRDSRQLPVARIQAVDVVQPLLARFLGLAELKIRLAGGGKESRLAYLSETRATQLRAALLAAHHGLDPATPEPAELAMAVVPSGRLVGSVALSAPTTVFVVVVLALVALSEVSTKAATAVFAFGFVYLFGMALNIWRRFNEQYGFTVASAPDGIRVRRGLIGTVAETIPLRRVQAVRQIEPLWWRLFGWCRLEVDLAGTPGRDRAAGGGHITKTLLPVGPRSLATSLRSSVIGTVGFEPSPPPRRARFKTPLSYHFLAAGHDDTIAVAVTGRVRKVTCWVPLEKAQSVRRVQGPLQRKLGLATVHLDVAGRRVDAGFRDRDADETDRLVDELAALSRVARSRALPDPPRRPVAVPTPSASTIEPPLPHAPVVPAGWFADPSGRHRGRYWDGVRWSEHVDDGGVPGIDPLEARG